MIRVDIDSIRVSLMSQYRIVVLKDSVSGRYLPIFIGPCEAEAIAMRLQKMKVERPLTHDLLKAMITEMGGEVQHIIVNDLRNDTFYARIIVEQNGVTREIDSRPSDAIALAVRLEVPIYVEESVMDRASIMPEEEVVEAGDDVEEGSEEGRGPGLSIFEDFVETLDLDDLNQEEDDDE
ncbi:MAG: bifunctional nuclease family protein [Anaerolineae bacterium]|jgi:bifunctional DNase/RNase|nr:bifunctional nuclease family protein [Anaerolineae bacterium]